MSILRINTPRVFVPLLQPARYKGAHGGRGSGKSHFFAEKLVEDCIAEPIRAVGIREIQKSIKMSVKQLIQDKINTLGCASMFNVMDDRIIAPHDGVIVFQGMQNHTAESIKSLEGFKRAWVEEAHTLSERSLSLLRPTIRTPGSELWFSWNPETKSAPVDQLLRGPNKIQDSIVVEANWRDNPYFPADLMQEMEMDKARDEDKYLHVWEGQYRQILNGAVYAHEIKQAIKEKRFTKVSYNSGKPVYVVWDIGFSDFCSLWFVQMIGGEFRIIDFYQNQFHKTAHYCKVMQDKEYLYSEIVLPHDAAEERINNDRTTEQQVMAAFPNATVTVLPNMGAGYLNAGIEAVRTIFPQCYFDQEKCEKGIEALSNYRYEFDEVTLEWSRKPKHDQFSHAADSFRYLAMFITEPPAKRKATKRNPNTSWMVA